jgi:tetratricopeptide (TPR) repeat protein
MLGRILLALSLSLVLSTQCRVKADTLADIQNLQSEYVAALKDGKVQKALDLSDSAVKLAPESAGLWSDHGAILSNLGRNDEALQAFDKSIELGPTAQYLTSRAGVLLQVNKNHEALQDCDRAISMDAEYYLAYNNRGTAELKLGLLDKAIQDLDKALSLKPDLQLALVSRAKIKCDTNKLESAKADVDKAIELSLTAGAFSTRALIYWKLQDKTHAVEDASKACELSPTAPYKTSLEFMQSHPITTPVQEGTIVDEKIFDNRTGH